MIPLLAVVHLWPLLAGGPQAANRRAAETQLLGVLTIPAPKTGLPKLRALIGQRSAGPTAPLARLSKGDLGPIGFDPLDPASLLANGIDVSQPAYMWISKGAIAAVVLELAVSEPERVDRSLERALARLKRVKPSPRSPDLDAGLQLALREGPATQVLRRGKRLFLQIDLEVVPSAADPLEAIALIEAARRPTQQPSFGDAATEGDSDLWVHLAGDRGVERVEGIVVLGPGGGRSRLCLFLDFAGGLVVGDLAAGSGTAHALIEGARSIGSLFDLTASLGPSSVALALDALHLAPQYGRAFTGEVHAFVTRGGSIVLGAALEPTKKEALASEVVRHLSGSFPEAKIATFRGPGGPLLLAWLPGEDRTRFAGRLEAVLMPKEATPEERTKAHATSPSRSGRAGAVGIDFYPREAIGLIERDPVGRLGTLGAVSKAVRAHAFLADFARGLHHARLEVTFPPGRIEIDAEWSERTR